MDASKICAKNHNYWCYKIFEEIRNRAMCGSRSQYVLPKILRAKNGGRALKIKVLQAILRPDVLYGSETGTLTQLDIKMPVWERNTSRFVWGNGVWRSQYHHELKDIYRKTDIVIIAKLNRIRTCRGAGRWETSVAYIVREELREQDDRKTP